MQETEYLELIERCQLNTPTYHALNQAKQKGTLLTLVLVVFQERIMTSVVVKSESSSVVSENALVVVPLSPEERKYCDGCGHFCKHFTRVRVHEKVQTKISIIFKIYCNLCISIQCSNQERQLLLY